jgi:hypothetical protein
MSAAALAREGGRPYAPATVESFELLPSAVREKIVAHLVRTKRLAPPAPGVAPLIRLRAGPLRDVAGRAVRDVTVHSRIRLGDEMRGYDTRFRVYSDTVVDSTA